jgi:Transposase
MMRFVGIDIGGERHALAVVDEDGTVLTKSTFFGEEAAGYKRVRELLGNADDCLVAMEATGHYWRNLFAFLASLGFEVALLNPLRTRRFAEEELERTKTDSVDALGIARFAAQKRPAPTPVSDEVTAELRELVRLRTRYVDELSDRMRQLHRAVDLGFPEFTRHVRIRTLLATAILARYPTARSFARVSVRKLARLIYDGRHRVGETLARALIGGAKVSVGNHHSEPYQRQVKYTCADIETPARAGEATGAGHRAQASDSRSWQTPDHHRWRRHADRRVPDRRVGRPEPLSRCRRARQLRRCGAASAAIGQARVLRCAGSSARKRAPAPSAVDADIGRRPKKPLVACALRPFLGCGQATEGSASGLYAQIAHCRL